MKRRSPYPAIAVVVVVIALIIFAAPRLYQLFKQEVAAKYASDVELLGNPQSHQSALEKLRAAHKLDPDNLEISRKLAEALNQKDPEEAIPHFQAIAQHPKSKIEDKLTLVRSAIEVGDFSNAESILLALDEDKLNQDTRNEFHFLRAKVFDSRGNIDQAIRQLRMILIEEESPSHKAAKFFFIRAAIRSSQPPLIQEAREMLHNMSLEEGNEGIEAIRFYFGISGYSEKDALDIFVKTLKHPLATNQDKLDAASLYQKTVPAQTALIIDSIKSELDFADANPKDMYDFCFWLAQIHQWESIVDHLTLNDALLSSKLYTLRLDALGNLDRWDEIIEATEQESVPIPDHFRLAFLARAYRQKGENETAFSQMDLILDSISDDRDALFKTCEYLERVHESESLLYLLDKAVLTVPALEAYACSKRIRHKLGTASLDELSKWYGILYSSSTSVTEFLSRKTYFDLLADKNRGESILNAKDLFDSDPSKLEHRVLMALSHLKTGKPEEALKVFDNTPIATWKHSTVGWKMLYANTMKKNGLADRAEDFLRTVPTAKLSRAEREGFANL